jgi:hypothetical protein
MALTMPPTGVNLVGQPIVIFGMKPHAPKVELSPDEFAVLDAIYDISQSGGLGYLDELCCETGLPVPIVEAAVRRLLQIGFSCDFHSTDPGCDSAIWWCHRSSATPSG